MMTRLFSLNLIPSRGKGATTHTTMMTRRHKLDVFSYDHSSVALTSVNRTAPPPQRHMCTGRPEPVHGVVGFVFPLPGRRAALRVNQTGTKNRAACVCGGGHPALMALNCELRALAVANSTERMKSGYCGGFRSNMSPLASVVCSCFCRRRLHSATSR